MKVCHLYLHRKPSLRMDNYDKQLHLYQNLNNMQNIMQSKDYKSNQEVSLEVHSVVLEIEIPYHF